MTQDQDKYILRFPEGMRERIKANATENNRSMNAEIVARLESSFEASKDPHTRQIIVRLLERIGELREAAEDAGVGYAERNAPVYDAIAYLEGLPMSAVKKARGLIEYETELSRHGNAQEVEKVINLALDEIVAYMRKKGWSVESPSS